MLQKFFMPNWYKCRRSLYLALVVMMAFATFVLPARADLTNVKDTLSDSRPSIGANHTIVFTLSVANNIIENDTIAVTFPAGFNLTSVVYTDVDLSASGSGEQTIVGATPNTTQWGAAVSGQVLTFTAPSTASTYIGGGETVTIEIGTNATAGVTGTNQIVNPTAASYTINITAAGASSETGALVVAIISGVTVSATIAESLTFAIAGVNDTLCTQDGAATAVTTTATAVPFGTMNANTFKKGCQTLTLNTNAGDGYSLTSQETDQLTNAGSQTIADTTCDTGTCTETTSAAWATASANHGLGHTCVGLDCVATYSSGSNFRQFASIADSETAVQMMASSSPVTNSTSTVVYKISVSGSQPSGDYTNVVVYIATAQFD
jgi:hypothetical protein